MDEVMEVACPNCQAQPGKRCTAPTDGSRKEVPWVHSARESAAANRGETKAKPVDRLLDAILPVLQHDPSVTRLECGCGESTSAPMTRDEVRRVIEHAAFAHSSRWDVNVVRHLPLLTGYEIGALMELPAVTGHEEQWRASRT